MRSAIYCAALVALGFGHAAAAQAQNVTIADTRVFPESLTSTKDGAIIFGSVGKGGIYRAAPGEMTAHLWIAPERSGMTNVLGVLADDRAHTLYACSYDGNKSSPEVADRLSAIRAFDLKSGAPKAAYPMPGGHVATCNDMAVARNGTLYVTDMPEGKILRLLPGAKDLVVWIEDEQLKEVDGIALSGDGTVYVNNFRKNKLFRIDADADGKAVGVRELALSRPVVKPDGMRSIGGQRFLLAEAGGHVDLVEIKGDMASIQTLLSREGTSFNGVTQTRGKWWGMDGRISYRSHPELKGKDPGPFVAEVLPAPK